MMLAVDPHARRILAQIAARVRRRHHTDGRVERHTIVHRRQRVGLRAAAGNARDAYARCIDIRQRLHEIESPDAIPKLHAERSKSPQLLFGRAEFVGQLQRVVVPDHVPEKRHITLPRQIHAELRTRIERLVLQPPVGPRARVDSAPRDVYRDYSSDDRDCRPDKRPAASPAGPFRSCSLLSPRGRRLVGAAVSSRASGRDRPRKSICCRRCALRCSHSARVLYSGMKKCVSSPSIRVLRISCANAAVARSTSPKLRRIAAKNQADRGADHRLLWSVQSAKQLSVASRALVAAMLHCGIGFSLCLMEHGAAGDRVINTPSVYPPH